MKQKVKIWNWIISISSIFILVWSIFSLIEHLNERKYHKKTSYIYECIEKLNNFENSEIEKKCACSCRHDYLFNKYGKQIYKESFVIPTKKDSLEVINCLLNSLKIKDINEETILEGLSK